MCFDYILKKQTFPQRSLNKIKKNFFSRVQLFQSYTCSISVLRFFFFGDRGNGLSGSVIEKELFNSKQLYLTLCITLTVTLSYYFFFVMEKKHMYRNIEFLGSEQFLSLEEKQMTSCGCN